MTAQAQALQHGLAQALVLTNAELRLVLKKNGMLTRDDRKKERKKPGLKRARRAPQWAKR
jgi:small subunit ribosomal protein S9